MPSYVKSTCCGADCYALDADEDATCWGQVVLVTEEYNAEGSWWVHTCEGHVGCYDEGANYRPPPTMPS